MVDSVYQVFVDLDARALEGGKVYVGEAYADPETSSVDLFWDDKLTIPAEQPLQTSGGYIVRSGTPTNVYTAANVYSVRVRDRSGGIVYYSASAGGKNGASPVTFPIPEGPPGKDAEAPQRADFIATAGQTRFPAVGKFGDVLGPGVQNPVFSYGSGIVATVNGQDIQPYNTLTETGDFIAPGGTDAITFTTPMEGGEEVTFLSFKLAGDGGNAKYPHKVDGVFVHLMRAPGATDSIDAFEAAVELANDLKLPVILADEEAEQPDGTFVVQRSGQNADPTAKGNVFGKGLTITSWGGRKATIKRLSTDAGAFPYILFGNPVGNGTSSNPSIIAGTDPTGIADLTITGLRFLGNVEQSGHQEQTALVHLSALDNALIEDCEFIGFPGDGLNVASGDIGGGTQIRYNTRVIVRRCLFDGINKNNRNGISYIDGTSITVEDCVFRNCTKPGGVGDDPFNPNTGFKHPGAIDCESNAFTGKYARMSDVIIRRNFFENTGSNAVALFLLPNRLNGEDLLRPIRNLTVENNEAINCNGGLVSTFGEENDAIGYDIRVLNNVAYNCQAPFFLRGARTTIEGNTFYNCDTAAEVGTLAASGDYGGVRQLTIRKNTFELCGNQIGAIRINRVDADTVIEDNLFKDTAVTGITFAGSEAAKCVVTGLTIRRNKFQRTPNAAKYLAYPIARFTFAGTPRIDTVTNLFADNEYPGMQTYDQVTGGQLMVPGLEVGSPPSGGRYLRGARLYGLKPVPPGEPDYWVNSYDSQASNTPVWVAVPTPGALPDPDANPNVAATLTSRTVNMQTDGKGRYTAAQDGSNVAQATSARSNPEIRMLAPASGTGGVYVFFAKTTVDGVASTDVALWFNRGVLRLVSGGQLNADMGSGYELGVPVRARRTEGGTLTVWRTDPQTGVESQVFSGGVSAGASIPGVLIRDKGNSINIQSIT